MHYTKAHLNALERFFKANLINSVTGLKSANLIGTINTEGTPNVAIFSSVVHLGANPALIGFIQRPLTDTSHTYHNIMATKQYTINHIPTNYIAAAHQTSAKYPDGSSEFEECNFTPQYISDFNAPFVEESSVKIGLNFVEAIPITYNNTTLIIGEVQHIIIDEKYIAPDGHINLETSSTAACTGLGAYYKAILLDTFPYAHYKEKI